MRKALSYLSLSFEGEWPIADSHTYIDQYSCSNIFVYLVAGHEVFVLDALSSLFAYFVIIDECAYADLCIRSPCTLP